MNNDSFTARLYRGPAYITIEAPDLESLRTVCARLDGLTGVKGSPGIDSQESAVVDWALPPGKTPEALDNGILAVEVTDPLTPLPPPVPPIDTDALTAQAVFGGTAPAVHLPPGAPSTAAVVPPPTAPEAGSSTAASVPLPPAQNAAAPVAAAPAAPTPPAPAVELDSAGLPWSPKIHSTSKTKIGNGQWRAKKGVDPRIVSEVTAELRALMAIPVTPPVPQPPPLPAAEGQPPAPPAVDVAPALTYAGLMMELEKPMTSGKLTLAELNEACAENGLKDIGGLMVRPDLLPAVRTSALKRVRP